MRTTPKVPKFYNLIALGLLLLALTAQMPFVPVTGLPAQQDAGDTSPAVPTLDEFSSQVANGNAAQIAGLYVNNTAALPVVQQPSGQPGYVSENNGVVTHFSYAEQYGTLGFLAHNYLSGASFFNINVGDIITVVYGDGSQQVYQVQELARYQALQSKNPYSDFIDIETGAKLSATDLFYEVYGVDGRLVLQTCIEAEGDDSWGRLFVVAVPYTDVPASVSEPNSFSWPDILSSYLN